MSHKRLPSAKTDAEIVKEVVDTSLGDPILNRGKPMLPWHYEFAYWLATLADPPSIEEQIAKAEELAQYTVTEKKLDALKHRKVFREYYAKLVSDVLTQARALLEKDYPNYVQAHADALREAIKLGDYKAVPAFTTPILDRVAPKKEDARAVAAVRIELAPQQQRIIDAEVIEVEVEELDD